MRVAVLVSGGKDSALALHHVLSEGYEVKCLATMISLREDSWMFHYPNIQLVDLFAEAVGIPVVKVETLGIKEKEVEDLKCLIKTLDVDGVVSGAIASTYQKSRIEGICKDLGLKCITPLWHKDPLSILNEILERRFEVVIAGVYAYGFGEEWLGRKIDATAIADLLELNRKYGISLSGEGGEYETLVLDTPLFKNRIRIVEAEKTWKGETGYYHVKKAVLENKQ